MTMVPFLLLYANGYRMSKENVVVETGGIFTHATILHGVLKIDGSSTSELSLFNHDVFIQSLIPKEYTLTYARENYTTWQKTVLVENQRVLDIAPFIIPLDPVFTVIPKTIPNTAGVNHEYSVVHSLFKSGEIMHEDILPLAEGFFAVPVPYLFDRNIALAKDGNALKAYWTTTFDLIPQMFCTRIQHQCNSEITILDDAREITDFLFYPGRNDVVLLAYPDKIIVREIDPRGIVNEALLYTGDKPEMRTDGSSLYIKEGSKYKKIELI